MSSSSSKIEFAVQMKCDSCVKSVKNTLSDLAGINNVEIDLESNTVVVDTILPTLEVQKKLEESGKKVVVKGFAGSIAGVAILDVGGDGNAEHIKGVVRFIQVKPNTCIIDGTIDGLVGGVEHRLEVHECGDLSGGCQTVGDIFNIRDKNLPNDRLYGDLGTVIPNQKTGRATFRQENGYLDLTDLIGRSLVLRQKDQLMVCGIIARSAGLFQNPKTICACDGITIWGEQTTTPRAVL